MATPEPMPGTSTRSPAPIRALVTTALHAVSPASGTAAASVHDSRPGLGATNAAGTAIRSAYVPWRGTPSVSQLGPGDSSLSPQLRLGLITTSSPTATELTPSPSSETTPAPSEPSTIGKLACCSLWPPIARGTSTPARIPRSRRLTDAARRSTTTSPG